MATTHDGAVVVLHVHVEVPEAVVEVHERSGKHLSLGRREVDDPVDQLDVVVFAFLSISLLVCFVRRDFV
jgi:hypothetical protein